MIGKSDDSFETVGSIGATCETDDRALMCGAEYIGKYIIPPCMKHKGHAGTHRAQMWEWSTRDRR